MSVSRQALPVAAVHGAGVGLAALAVGLLGLGLLFRDEAVAAVQVWQESTAFGHCFLVLPIAAWLAWDRRDALAGLAPRPVPWLALLGLPLAALWLAAERLGLMEGRQLAALFLVWLLAVSCLGWRIARAMAAPLAYLIFLVPFGAFLVPALQDFTARFIDVGLTVADIPHAVTATMIEIPEGFFRVAEACAGLRFLIAAIAFGALYACIVYSGIWRRIAFIGACIVVPVLANGMRALGIVLLGHLRGSAEAGAVDHVVYGWLFFSAVILFLLLLGLPFRQSWPVLPPSPGQPAASRSGGRLAAASLAVLACAAAGPASSAWLERRAAAPATGRMAAADRLADRMPLPAGCSAEPSVGGVRRVTCNGTRLEIRVAVFSRLAGPSVVHAWRDATSLGDDEHVKAAWLDLASGPWRVSERDDPAETVAASLRLDGRPAPTGLALRLRLARNAFVAEGSEAVLITVTGQDGGGQSRVLDLVRAQPRLTAD